MTSEKPLSVPSAGSPPMPSIDRRSCAGEISCPVVQRGIMEVLTPLRLLVTIGISAYRHSPSAAAAASRIAPSRLSRTMRTMNTAQTATAARPQSTAVIRWLWKIAMPENASSFQRRFSPSTTSYSPSTNSGRNAIASDSPTLKRVYMSVRR